MLRTGADGGHAYIKGRGLVPGHGETDIYAYFGTREAEAQFVAAFRGEDVTVTTESLEFVRGMGAYLTNCRVTPYANER